MLRLVGVLMSYIELELVELPIAAEMQQCLVSKCALGVGRRALSDESDGCQLSPTWGNPLGFIVPYSCRSRPTAPGHDLPDADASRNFDRQFFATSEVRA